MYSKEELKQLKHDFWTLFGIRSKKLLGDSFRKHWILYKTKIPGLEFKFSVERGMVKTILEINHKDEDTRLKYYEKLSKYRAILEYDFEGGLEWELVVCLPNGKEVCQIKKSLEGVDFHKKEHWPKIFDFLSTTMFQLEENFIEIWDTLKVELKQ